MYNINSLRTQKQEKKGLFNAQGVTTETYLFIFSHHFKLSSMCK